MTTINLVYCGVDGSGATVAKAKQDAASKIERCISEGFNPAIVSHPKYPEFIGLVVRDTVETWGYRFFNVNPSELAFPVHPVSACSCGFESRDAAIVACRKHAAQVAMRVDSDERTGLEFLHGLHEMHMRDHLGYIAWQRDYQRLRMAGATDSDAHAGAKADLALVAKIAA